MTMVWASIAHASRAMCREVVERFYSRKLSKFSAATSTCSRAWRSRVVDDLFQLHACGCVIDPLLAALRANGRVHFAHHDYAAAEIGAEGCFTFRLFAATNRASLIRIAPMTFSWFDLERVARNATIP